METIVVEDHATSPWIVYLVLALCILGVATFIGWYGPGERLPCREAVPDWQGYCPDARHTMTERGPNVLCVCPGEP